MNIKDARDMHRLAVGAGEAPTDAQIDALSAKPLMDKKSKRDFARAVLALTTPPPAPSSPAPVACDTDVDSTYCPVCSSDPKAYPNGCPVCRNVWPYVPNALAVPSTVQGLSDAAPGTIRFDIPADECFEWDGSPKYPMVKCMDCKATEYGITKIKHKAGCRVHAILANPAAPSPESGS